MAANVGFEAIKCWQRQALEAIANGTQDSRQYKQAIFWLRKVGLNDPEFINGKALSTYGDLMSAAKADPSLSSIHKCHNDSLSSGRWVSISSPIYSIAQQKDFFISCNSFPRRIIL